MFLALPKYLKVGSGKLSIPKMILRILQIHGTPSSLQKNQPNSIPGEIRRLLPRAGTQKGEGKKSGGKRGGTRNRLFKGGE